MTKLAANDERLLNRFVDGELPATAMDDCRRRLEQEPRLRQHLQELQAVRACFRTASPAAVAAPAGFTAGLMAAVRQRSLTQSWRDEAGDAPQLTRLCRRLLVAAALLIGTAAIWHLGLFRHHEPSVVEAANELQRLDRLIDAAAQQPPAAVEKIR